MKAGGSGAALVFCPALKIWIKYQMLGVLHVLTLTNNSRGDDAPKGLVVLW